MSAKVVSRRNLLEIAATGGAALAVAATAAKLALAQDTAPNGGVGGSGRNDYDVFDLGDVVLQSGITLPRAKLAYKTYGKLAATRDNAVLMPTYYGGRHSDTEGMIGAGRALDPARWLIIVPNMLGNGLSSSPSNTSKPFDRAGFPNVTLYDNVVCQHRLVIQKLEIDRLRLLSAFQWERSRPFIGVHFIPKWSRQSRPCAVPRAHRPITTCSWTGLKLH